MPEPKIAVIGAGIAGLTAADWLTAAGCEVTIYEARERPGGRIFTVFGGEAARPIELGAEFIHGDDNETWKVLEKHSHFQPQKFPDLHWDFRDGKLTANRRFWKKLDQVMGEMEDVQRDTSFTRFLRRLHDKPKEIRALAKDFVEGFHAAEPDKISVISLEEAAESADETNGQKVFRLPQGYGSLVDWLVGKLQRRNTAFHFSQVIDRVRWRKGKVELFSGKEISGKHDALLITVPLGVLQLSAKETGAITFEPQLRATKQLLNKLRMGNVMKLTLIFDEPFWPMKIFGFIHALDELFPTWWMNKGSPIVVGWSGGPKADELSGQSQDEIVSRALSELSRIFDVSESEIRHRLSDSFMHDWRNDPFARGAYSFLPVGTTNIPQKLSDPIDNTLFFAGELFSPPGEQGTVHGAMASGKLAACKILQYACSLRNGDAN